MYEAHFGLSGPPFQLNPDPAFYFESKGHGNALAYLKFGAHQGEGFIVVTGEIGAGKTTLVRTLLESLDPRRLVAAQVVSTQLEAGDLLRTILAAFGVPTQGESKAQLIATLEGFLTAVAAKGRRALLVVDEAQNLDRVAVEELRMLSNFQLGNQGLLQSFLVGQPELRVLLQSKAMEQLRQRVIASCHLGPMEASETRAYVEHRLRHVGWNGFPSFDEQTHVRVHHWTGGIPRRINRLCNRLLLGAFLADQAAISADSVDRTALELGAEIGESAPSVETPSAAAPASQGTGSELRADAMPGVETRARSPTKPLAPLICIVDVLSDYLEAGALAQCFADRPALPSVVVAHPGCAAEFECDPEALVNLPLPALDIHLGTGAGRDAHALAEAMVRFDAVLDEHAPSAVMALGSSNSALACAMLAHKRGFAIIRPNAGRHRDWMSPGERMNARLLEQVADLLYAEDLAAQYSLHRVGVANERIHCVGDLAANVVHLAQRCALPQDPSGKAGATDFALVTVQWRPERSTAASLQELVSMLSAARNEIDLRWAVDPGTLAALGTGDTMSRLRAAGIAVVPALGYLRTIQHLASARFVIAGPEGRFVDEGKALGRSSLVLSHGTVTVVRATETTSTPPAGGMHQLVRLVHELARDAGHGSEGSASSEFWAGGAAARITAHLEAWLRKQARSRTRVLAQVAKPAA